MTLPRPDNYSGWITDDFRAAAADFHDLVRGAGQPVTIQGRDGLPDSEVIAFLWQEDNSGEGSVSEPKYKVLGWQAFFIPAESTQLLTRSWWLTDHQGRSFVPDGDVQDIAEQGILLWAHLLPLPDRTRVYLLTFAVTTGEFTENAGGQLEAVTAPISAPVRLEYAADPKVSALAGADAADVTLIGRWGTLQRPTGKPDGIGWGDTAPLDLDGQPGTLTLKLAYPDDDTAAAEVFGTRFIALWRAGPEVG